MGFMIDGREIATTPTGFLENLEDWMSPNGKSFEGIPFMGHNC